MPSYTESHDVIINLQARGENSELDWLSNRIALKADNISISTTKNVLSTPLPFTGLYYGEAMNVALDWGNSTKNISISGIITDQVITKKFRDSPSISVYMTAFEVTQLLHSYVDSSFMQEQQNLNSLIILIPTRIDKSYNYHPGISDTTFIDDCPKMPFTYKVRGGTDNKSYDARQKKGIGKQLGSWPNIITSTTQPGDVPGFVRSFNSTFIGGQPFVEFSLDFEVATNPMTEGGL